MQTRLIKLLTIVLLISSIPIAFIFGGVYMVTELDIWYWQVVGLVLAGTGAAILIGTKITIDCEGK